MILKKKEVIIGRDKFGEKPVFYFVDEKKIIIGSELKIYKEGRHEMLNELNKQEVYELILSWLNKKTLQ